MSDTYRGLIIRPPTVDKPEQTIEPVTVTDYKSMQRAIGCDCFTTAFRLPSRRGAPHSVDAFCDDEGLLHERPEWCLDVSATIYPPQGYMFAGAVLIIGGNDETGDTESLSDEDAAAFAIDPFTHVIGARHDGLLVAHLDWTPPPGWQPLW